MGDYLLPSCLFLNEGFKEGLNFFLHGCQRSDVARMGENEEGNRLMLSHEKKMYIIKERKHGLLFQVINSGLVLGLPSGVVAIYMVYMKLREKRNCLSSQEAGRSVF